MSCNCSLQCHRCSPEQKRVLNRCVSVSRSSLGPGSQREPSEVTGCSRKYQKVTYCVTRVNYKNTPLSVTVVKSLQTVLTLRVAHSSFEPATSELPSHVNVVSLIPDGDQPLVPVPYVKRGNCPPL